MTLVRIAASLTVCAVALAGPSSPARAEWATDGNPMTLAANAQGGVVLAPDGAGGALSAWVDGRSGYNTDIFAQRLNAVGFPAPGWSANGNAVTLVACQKYTVSIAPDGSGGALLAWADNRCQTYADIYAARLTAAGGLAPGWGVNGTPVCLADNDQLLPVVTNDGAGGMYIAWQDRRYGYWSIHTQHLDSLGTHGPGWPADGLRVCGPNGNQTSPAVIADGTGGAFYVWEDRRGTSCDVYAQRVGAAGIIAPGWPWSGQPVCIANGDQVTPTLMADGVGGFYVAWSDHRGADGDIYVTRMTAAGVPAPGWPVDGLPVCTSPGEQRSPTLVDDGEGGVIVVWQDARGSDNDVYAQRLDATGAIVAGWIPGGVPLCTAPGDQLYPQATPDRAGGVIATWQDGRSGDFHIYAQHLAGDGTLAQGWIADGLGVCTAAGSQLVPRIVADGSGGAIIAWVDSRIGNGTAPDIYAARVLGSGQLQTRVTGIAAEHHDGQTFLTWTCPPGTGWTYRVYASPQPIRSAADIASATPLGAVQDSTWYDRRLSVLRGQVFAYAIDSLGPPLQPSQGLFVSTPAADGSTYYAVTSQLGSLGEDPTVLAGNNALVAPVAEQLGIPRPVYQQTLTISLYVKPLIYTLWTSDRSTPLFPAMANRPGMAYDCAVVPGGNPPNNPLFLDLHQRQGNFLNGVYTTGYPGEWVLGLDDPLDTEDSNSFWYGYHEGYNLTQWVNPVPSSGEVCAYTDRRMAHTVRWAIRNFSLDSTRVVELGYSMGAIGDLYFAVRHPDLVSALMVFAGKVDFSYLTEPFVTAGFNPGLLFRNVCDRLWGGVSTDLPDRDGGSVWDQLDVARLVGMSGITAIPPMETFFGKCDSTMGWAEKIPFYRAMETHRQGGFHFFDQRDHLGVNSAWTPMESSFFLYRFRTNLSFPAFSNCSANGDPGNGTPSVGDSVGTINGAVDWDTAVTDLPGAWGVSLTTRALTAQWGTIPAPESLTVDVTPRRLQTFTVSRDTVYVYQVVRSSDRAIVQS
ncbi:MAG TPA: hypothetical protein VI792_03720, partial [Candidatus Eisenbacteria bacterium]